MKKNILKKLEVLFFFIINFLYAMEIGILKENNFPSVGIDKRITPELIKGILERWYPEGKIKYLSVEELTKENLKTVKAVINPYGEAYPEEKSEVILDIFTNGKSWINLGGFPFSVPVRNIDNKWVVGKKDISFIVKKLSLPITYEFGTENTPAKPDTFYLTEEGEKFFGSTIQQEYMIQPNLKFEEKWRYSFRCTPEIVRFNPFWIKEGDYVFNLANALSVNIPDERLSIGTPIKKGEGIISILEFGSEPYIGSKFVLFGFTGEKSPLLDSVFGKETSEESIKILSEGGAGQKVIFNEEDILLERLLPPVIEYCLKEEPCFYIIPKKGFDVFYLREPIEYILKIYNPTDKKVNVQIFVKFTEKTEKYFLNVNPKEIKYLPVKFTSDKLGVYDLNVRIQWDRKYTLSKIYPVAVVQKVQTSEDSFAGINSLPHPANELFFNKDGFITHLELMKYAGISYLHGGFPHMNHIYKSPGIFKWGDPDYEFVHEQLSKYGLYPHGNVVGMAQWAAALNAPKATEWWWAPPKDIKYWKEYVEEGMEKLGKRLKEVTVWGEMWGLTPEQYVEMFNVVTDVVKKTAPHIKVGGPVTGWIDLQMIEKVLKECPDIGAIDFHVYYGAQAWNWSGGWENMIEDINKVKELMKKYNKENLPIWITEMGKSISASFESEEMQAREMIKAITIARANNVSRIFWFSFRSSSGGKEFEYSILKSPRFPRPAYVAYNNLIYLLKDAEIDKTEIEILDYPGYIEKIEEQIFTFLFKKNDKKIFIGWTSEPKPRTAWKFGPDIDMKIRILSNINRVSNVDLFGNPKNFKDFEKRKEGLILNLKLSDTPTILILE